MRPEIIEALNQAEQEREKTEEWLNEHGWWPVRTGSTDEMQASDFSYMLTDEQFANQERVRWIKDRLRTCLLKKKYLGARDVYSVKPSSLTLEWGELETEVEIELSRYGSLAAVFVYGDVALPLEADKDISDCLQSCGLLRITDEEIAELQEQGVHYFIF